MALINSTTLARLQFSSRTLCDPKRRWDPVGHPELPLSSTMRTTASACAGGSQIALLVENCSFVDNYQGIEIEFEGGDIVIDSCVMTGNTSHAIQTLGIETASDLQFTNNTILENAGRAIWANGTSDGPSTAHISGNYFEGNSGDIVDWGINGSIDIRHNHGQGLNTGRIYRFDNGGTNSIVVFQDSIWNSYRYMHTGSNTTAHIDSLYLKGMWFGGLEFSGSNHDVTVAHSVLDGSEEEHYGVN